MAHDIGKALEEYGVDCTYFRLADYNLKPGVEADMGKATNGLPSANTLWTPTYYSYPPQHG